MMSLNKKNHIVSEKATFWLLGSMLVLFFVAYVFFVNQAVRNVVQRNSIDKQVAEVNGTLSSLELRYIDLKNTVTVEFAHDKGFHEIPAAQFVGTDGAKLSLNR